MLILGTLSSRTKVSGSPRSQATKTQFFDSVHLLFWKFSPLCVICCWLPVLVPGLVCLNHPQLFLVGPHVCLHASLPCNSITSMSVLLLVLMSLLVYLVWFLHFWNFLQWQRFSLKWRTSFVTPVFGPTLHLLLDKWKHTQVGCGIEMMLIWL